MLLIALKVHGLKIAEYKRNIVGKEHYIFFSVNHSLTGKQYAFSVSVP